MIDRYTRAEMGRIWSPANKFEIWKEIEVLACEAQAELGSIGITKDEAAQIRERAAFEVERIDEIERYLYGREFEVSRVIVKSVDPVEALWDSGS